MRMTQAAKVTWGMRGIELSSPVNVPLLRVEIQVLHQLNVTQEAMVNSWGVISANVAGGAMELLGGDGSDLAWMMMQVVMRTH